MAHVNEKLLLSVEAMALSSGKPEIKVRYFETRSNKIIALSCISLILSQLTVLTPPRPKALCRKLLRFIDTPNKSFKTVKYVSGFKLEFYKREADSFFNQFYPQFNPHLNISDNNAVESDIVSLLLNFLT